MHSLGAGDIHVRAKEIVYIQKNPVNTFYLTLCSVLHNYNVRYPQIILYNL